MTDQTTRPTLARRHLGRMLRRLRQEAGKTHADITAAGLGSRSKMSAIESGRIPVRADTVYGLSALYRVPPELTDQLLTLAAATRRTDARSAVDPAVPERFSVFADLVDTAATLRIHCVELVHELLQTEDYARAVVAADPGSTPAGVEHRLAFRRHWQTAFFGRRPPGRLQVVLTAGALELVVGSREVLARQLAHLRALDEAESTDVRVLAATNGLHGAMCGGFVLIEFDDPLNPPLVHVDKLTGAEYVERADHVATYRRAFDAIAAQAVPIAEYQPAVSRSARTAQERRG